jgi:hypothetical protein
MQAGAELDALDGVAERRQLRGERLDAGTVAPRRKADEEAFTEPEDVAAVERRRRLESSELPVWGERAATESTSGPAGLGARPRQHRDLVDHDGRVLDEHRIGQPGALRQSLDAAAELDQRLLVGRVLRARPREDRSDRARDAVSSQCVMARLTARVIARVFMTLPFPLALASRAAATAASR